MKLAIRPVKYSSGLFAPLVAEALHEGGIFLLRLKDEWENGTLRFDQPGEVLLGAFLDGEMVAVGGITRDPYAPAPGLGRVRHLYVLNRHRRQGIGRALVKRLIEHGRRHFSILRLTTERSEAAELYESCGFVRQDARKQTHRLEF